MKVDQIFESARNVLQGNWNESFTIPSPTLYPHERSWYSAFIAIGNSYSSTEKAIKELEFLFDAQWNDKWNGRLISYLMKKKKRIFLLGTTLNEITRSPYAPKSYRHISYDTASCACHKLVLLMYMLTILIIRKQNLKNF